MATDENRIQLPYRCSGSGNCYTVWFGDRVALDGASEETARMIVSIGNEAWVEGRIGGLRDAREILARE